MEIPNEGALKTLKTYLPWICILVLAWMYNTERNENKALREARLQDQIQLVIFWRDAFTRTSDAFHKSGRDEDYGNSHQNNRNDSDSSDAR